MTQYDIHFQPVPDAEITGYQCFEFGYAAALKVSGFQSLINRWAKTLMTPRGSNPLNTEEGTNFPNLIGGNIARVTTGVRDLVATAIEDANEQVRQQDIEGYRAAKERLQGGELVDFTEAAAGFSVWVKLTNVAGTSATFRLATV
jgi:hypothetical protein